MDIIYQTRFSFYGKSGWQSAASEDPDQLYDPDRLAHRFDLFENITLPSLAAQTDPDFKLYVLSGKKMPKPWRRRLRRACIEQLGEERCLFRFARKSPAAKVLRNWARDYFPDQSVPVTQVVLDDDDALSMDFTARLRREAIHMASDLGPEGYAFLSFATGYSLDLRQEGPPQLFPRNVPFTNLGLALVAAPERYKSPYATAHRAIGERHPCRMIAEPRPFYMRTLHGLNDSRGHQEDTPLSPEEVAQALEYFPSLAPLFAGAPAPDHDPEQTPDQADILLLEPSLETDQPEEGPATSPPLAPHAADA